MKKNRFCFEPRQGSRQIACKAVFEIMDHFFDSRVAIRNGGNQGVQMELSARPAFSAKKARQSGFSFAFWADLKALQGYFLKTFLAEPKIAFLAAEANYREKCIQDNFFDFFKHFLDFWLIFCFEAGAFSKLYSIFGFCSKNNLRCFLKYGNIDLLKKYLKIQK